MSNTLASAPGGNVARPIDRMPHLPGAGITGGAPDETAERTLKPELYAKPPPTPQEIAKWRKQIEPGKTVLHPGVASDLDHTRLSTYGRVEPVGVKVHEIMNVAPKSE